MKKPLPYMLSSIDKYNKLICSVVITFVLSTSCEEFQTPLVADFTPFVIGEAPNAKITITNKSIGADSYHWIFGDGANPKASIQRSPYIIVDKPDTIKIKLHAFKGINRSDYVEKQLLVKGYGGLYEYPSLRLGITPNSKYPRLFSTTTGNEYYSFKDIEDLEEKKTIDIYYKGDDNRFIFGNPYNLDKSLQNVIVENKAKQLTSQQFDEINHDKFLRLIKIKERDIAVNSTDLPAMVMIKKADGRAVIIRINEVKADYIEVDIKTQKYIPIDKDE